MPAQYTPGSANERYKKKLFVETANGFVEVNAKIVEPYLAPSPTMNMKELRVLNAPSHFQQMGISSYQCSLTLLFKDKVSYVEYLAGCGWTHKFYDERGAIFTGALSTLKPRPVEASTKYVVEVGLILIKKNSVDDFVTSKFVDLVDESTGSPHFSKESVDDLVRVGALAIYERDGEPILYFRPTEFMTRAEMITVFMRTKRFLEKHLIE